MHKKEKEKKKRKKEVKIAHSHADLAGPSVRTVGQLDPLERHSLRHERAPSEWGVRVAIGPVPGVAVARLAHTCHHPLGAVQRGHERDIKVIMRVLQWSIVV